MFNDRILKNVLEDDEEEEQITSKNTKNNDSGISEVFFDVISSLYEISPPCLFFVIPLFEKGIMVNFF
jgi:hypothetical protein